MGPKNKTYILRKKGLFFWMISFFVCAVNFVNMIPMNWLLYNVDIRSTLYNTHNLVSGGEIIDSPSYLIKSIFP